MKESTVTQAAREFRQRIREEKGLKKLGKETIRKLNLLNVEICPLITSWFISEFQLFYIFSPSYLNTLSSHEDC